MASGPEDEWETADNTRTKDRIFVAEVAGHYDSEYVKTVTII